MSRAIALVRFKDGTILRGCYNGNSDYMSRWLITDEELQKNFNGSVFSWDSLNCASSSEFNNVLDSEEVEIFSDYGNGSTWTGKASKTSMCITDGLFIGYIDDWSSDIPNWVIKYFQDKGWDYTYLIR